MSLSVLLVFMISSSSSSWQWLLTLHHLAAGQAFLIPGKISSKSHSGWKRLEREREIGRDEAAGSSSSRSTSECKKQKDNPHFFDDSDHSLQIDDKCLGFFSFTCQMLRQQVAYDLYTILPLSCCLLRLLLLILCML